MARRPGSPNPLVPLGLMLAVRLIPPEVMAEHRVTAARATERPVSRVAAALFVAIWIGGAALLLYGWLG